MKELDLSIFAKADKADWLQLAQDQLKGADPMEQLKWETHGLTGLVPYYDYSDTANLSYLSDFFSGISGHRWKLYQQVKVSNEAASNKEALNALMGGSDGIIFHLERETDFSLLLKEIDINICDISIISDFPINDVPDGISGMRKVVGQTNCLFEQKVHSSAVDQIENLIGNFNNESFLHRTAFSDFFLEVAAVRALRYLIEKEKKGENVHIHTSVPNHATDEYQWFFNTTAGLAAIIGGSHSIDMHTAIGDSRITRNVGNLIREESKIEEYQDQCGGSYFVENLTHSIIQEVLNRLSK